MLKRFEIAGIFFLLILIICLIPGWSKAAGPRNFEIKVQNVRFKGVEAVNKKALAELLTARVPVFWKFWEPHPVIHTKDLEDDLLRIKQYYQTQGYYQVTAEYEIEAIDPEDAPSADIVDKTVPAGGGSSPEDDHIPGYEIRFHINEGPPVIIRNISIQCMCELETLSEDTIRAVLSLQPGVVFKTGAYEQSKTAVRKLLGNRSYPFAKVRGSATVDLNDNSADIDFAIEPGECYHFGEIRIKGHEDHVREKVIRRAITFTSGEKYTERKLDESHRNLFDLNIFKTALIQPGVPDEGSNRVPVDIQVKPRKKRNIKLGVGYGTDDGLRLQAAWGDRNMTGWADRLTLSARRSDILENIYAEYLVPYFMSARNNLVSNAGYKREEKDYYTLHQTGTELNFYRKLENNWFSSIGYMLESNRPENVRVEDADGLADPRDTEDYLVSSVKFHIEHNTIDDVLYSQRGTAVGLTIENASDYLGSEISYIRPGVDARVFVPLSWNMVLALRTDFKTIQKSGDTDYIPISKQFFLGGSKSVRGYGFEKLGVIDENDVIRDVSGLSSFTGNLELRFPIYNDFGGVAFLDAGALNDDSFRMDFRSLRYTAGLGLRYRTIIGPIQLDFGYQLNPAESAATDDADLVDLLEKDRWYLHFNIGQTF